MRGQEMLDHVADAEGREAVTGELGLRLHSILTREARKPVPSSRSTFSLIVGLQDTKLEPNLN